MSAQVCSTCKKPNSYLARNQGRLLCPQCQFGVQQPQQEVEAAAPRYEEPAPVYDEYREQGEAVPAWEGARVEYYQHEVQPKVEEEEPQRYQEEMKQQIPANFSSGPACYAHGRPSDFYCLCSLSSCGRIYLCAECMAPHCSAPGLRHEPLPISAGVDDPLDIPSYRERVVMLEKINTLKAVLKEQKTVFDVNCTSTLESLKLYLDEAFSIMASQVESYYETFERVLNNANLELQTWSRVNPQLSKETELLIHHCEISPERFVFLDFDSFFRNRVNLHVSHKEMSPHPFEDLIKGFGNYCPCQRCENTRTVLGVASVVPWTCLSCKTVRTLEKTCDGCGCGKTKADYLRYCDVELRDHDTRWICKKCSKMNDVETLTCASCRRKVNPQKKESFFSTVYSHFVNTG